MDKKRDLLKDKELLTENIRNKLKEWYYSDNEYRRLFNVLKADEYKVKFMAEFIEYCYLEGLSFELLFWEMFSIEMTEEYGNDDKYSADHLVNGLQDIYRGYKEAFDSIASIPYILKYLPEEYNEFLQEILDNTYDKIKENVKIMSNDAKLPLNQYRISTEIQIEEIENEKEEFIKVFTNKRSLGQLKGRNHFLDYLLDSSIVLTEDNKFVFKEHMEALSIGYTEKAILLSINKSAAIRELKTKIKHLEDFDNDESKALVDFSKHIIQFIEQQKSANILPFIVLSQQLGITKKQAKNYAKRLFSLKEETFIKNLDTFVLSTPKKIKNL